MLGLAPDKGADWNSTWVPNSEYAGDGQIQDLLARLKSPIEKFIVSQFFEEFDLQLPYVHVRTEEPLPPMRLVEKPVKEEEKKQ